MTCTGNCKSKMTSAILLCSTDAGQITLSLKERQTEVLRSMGGEKAVAIIRHLGSCYRAGADSTGRLGPNEDLQISRMWKEMLSTRWQLI